MEAGPHFNTQMFDQMLLDEYRIAFNLSQGQITVEQQQELVKGKGDKIGDLIKKVIAQNIKNKDTVDAEVNKLTTMDSYRHSLYAINLSRREIFDCGIERTDLEFSSEFPRHESYINYRLSNNSESLSEDDIKKNYIKNVLFQAFYTYCSRHEIPIPDIYRFFIRMLCLFSGFVIPDLITGLTQQMENSVFLTPITPQPSPESSPPQPQQPQPQRVSRVLHRKNVIYLTPSRELSFVTLLIYEITDTQGNTSGIFEIPIGYSLQGMSNRPLYMSLSTLFDMINEFRQTKHKFRSDIFIKLRDENIKKLNSKESTFTTIFKGFQYIGGRTKKTSKKMHRKSRSQSQKVKVKKSKSKSQSQKVKVKK
jgi:hypothetical protein